MRSWASKPSTRPATTSPATPRPRRTRYVYAIKRRAFLNGLGVSGTGVRNDFTLPEPGKARGRRRTRQALARGAAKLDAPVLRVFDGRGEAKGPTERADDRLGGGAFKDVSQDKASARA